jgi:hypothetical protein
MNLLQLVQQATAEMGVPIPSQVAGNTATDTAQQFALLNALGSELCAEFDWQALEREYRFTTQYLSTTGNLTANSAVVVSIPATTGLDTTYMVSGTGINQDTYVQSVDSGSQVTLTQPATSTGTGVSLTFGKTKYAMPSDYLRQINRTHYDKSKRWEMLGPETPQQWQFLKSSYISTGPRIRYRIMGGFFQIWPLLGTPEYLGFEYISNSWVTDANGNGKSLFSSDSDACVFPDRLMVLGLKRKYFEIKGFDTTALARDYLTQLDIAKATTGGAPTLSMAPRLAETLIGWEQIPDSGYGR